MIFHGYSEALHKQQERGSTLFFWAQASQTHRESSQAETTCVNMTSLDII